MSALELLSLEKTELRSDLIDICNFLKKGTREGSARLCSLLISDKMSGSDTKLYYGRGRLDVRKNFFSMDMVKHCKDFLARSLMFHACQ